VQAAKETADRSGRLPGMRQAFDHTGDRQARHVPQLLARPQGGGHMTPDREKAGLRATTLRTPPPQPSPRTSASDLSGADALAVCAIDGGGR